MGRATVLVGKAITAEADNQANRQHGDREKSRQVPRLAVGDVDQARHRFVRPKHDSRDQRYQAPADQPIGGQYDQAEGDAGRHQPVAAIDEDPGKNRHPNQVAEQQQQQAAKGEFLGTPPHHAADPVAEPAGDAPLSHERDATGEHHPAEIDQRPQGGAVLVKGAPFARQRRRGVGQHADIRHRLAFELHGDVFKPARGTHLGGSGRGRHSRGRRLGRPAGRGRNQNPRQDREPCQTPRKPGRPSDACEPQPHASASRRMMPHSPH